MLVLSMLSCSARAFLQETGAGAPLGKLHVAPSAMAGRCLTMVSPHYPQGLQDTSRSYSVVVRVVIWKTGTVSPMSMVSGPSALEAEAMSAVRLWRYKPFAENGEALDVTTDVRVNFDPTMPGGLVSHPGR